LEELVASSGKSSDSFGRIHSGHPATAAAPSSLIEAKQAWILDSTDVLNSTTVVKLPALFEMVHQ